VGKKKNFKKIVENKKKEIWKNLQESKKKLREKSVLKKMREKKSI
jgi:hypothetical protein